MKTINPEINWEELITSNLPTEPGYEHAVSFKGIPVASVDEVFDKIATDYENIYAFNNWEWYWSQNVIVDGKTYQIRGSAHSGSLCIQLED